MDVPLIYETLWVSVRNLGWSGLVACAISAIDLALWDLKSRCLDLNLSPLLERYRNQVEIYGSDDELAQQLSAWVEENGCHVIKNEDWVKPSEGSGTDKGRKQGN